MTDMEKAWDEVQSVLPEGWCVTLYDQGAHGPLNPAPDQPFGTPRYQAFAKLGILSSHEKHVGADEHSPAAALHNLAEAIRQHPEPHPKKQIVVGWTGRG